MTDRSGSDDFDAFYRAEFAMLIRYLMTAGGSEDEACTAAQHAFVKLLPVFDIVTNPRAWTRRVARNHLIQIWRTRKPEAASDHMRMPDLDHLEPAYKIEHAYLVGWLLKRLGELPQRQREVMALTIDGYRPQQIAELMDVDATRVRSNLRLARQRLQQAMIADGLLPERHRKGGE